MVKVFQDNEIQSLIEYNKDNRLCATFGWIRQRPIAYTSEAPLGYLKTPRKVILRCKVLAGLHISLCTFHSVGIYYFYS